MTMSTVLLLLPNPRVGFVEPTWKLNPSTARFRVVYTLDVDVQVANDADRHPVHGYHFVIEKWSNSFWFQAVYDDYCCKSPTANKGDKDKDMNKHSLQPRNCHRVLEIQTYSRSSTLMPFALPQSWQLQSEFVKIMNMGINDRFCKPVCDFMQTQYNFTEDSFCCPTNKLTTWSSHVITMIILSINSYKIAVSYAPQKSALGFYCFMAAISHTTCATTHIAASKYLCLETGK